MQNNENFDDPPEQTASTMKIRLLRFVWGVIPWLAAAVMIAFMVVLWNGLIVKHGRLAEAKNAAMDKEIPAIKVITLTLEPRQLVDKISLPAEVTPFEELWIKTEAKGQIVKVAVEEGQDVKKGQLLLKIDDRDYRSRLARVEASYQLATLELNRMKTLRKKRITSESSQDEAVARYMELEAQVREAKLALSRCRITAPISGRINELKTRMGDVLDINESVAQLLQIDRVKVTVGVPESDVAAVFDLTHATLVIEALNNRTVVGEKVFLSSKPRTLARLYDLELLVSNPDRHILPGMFAQVELVKKEHENALAIPLYAVIVQGEDRFVYIEKAGKAERRQVGLGVLIGWQVHVKSGLNPGERVIVVGHRFLDNGQAVQVIKNVTRADEIFAS
jgi:membrane fusion protein, multidrug efflux system